MNKESTTIRRRAPTDSPVTGGTGQVESSGRIVLPIARWPKLTISWVGFALYLIVIHSYRLAIGQAAILMSMFGIFIERRPLRFPSSFSWCVGLLAWAAMTILFSEVSGQGWETWQEYVKVLLILIVATNASKDAAQVSATLILWLGCFALWPVRGTLFNFAYGISRLGRYAWNFIFSNPNDLASICLLILGLSLVGSRSRQSKLLRLASILGTIVLTVIIFLTQSRGAFLGLTVFALIAVTTHQKRIRALLGTATLAALVFVVAPASVWTRLGGLTKATSTANLAEVDPEGSAENRYRIWQIAIDMSKDHPILGVGFGNFPMEFKVYLERRSEWRGIRALHSSTGRDTHSTYLNALAEMGYVGLTLLLGFIASSATFLWKTAKRLGRDSPKQGEQFKYLFASWIAYWVTSAFATDYVLVMPYLFIGFATALAIQYGQVGRTATVVMRPSVGEAAVPSPRHARRSA